MRTIWLQQIAGRPLCHQKSFNILHISRKEGNRVVIKMIIIVLDEPFLSYVPALRAPPWSNGSVLHHILLPTVFESRCKHILTVFHLWLRFIGGRLFTGIQWYRDLSLCRQTCHSSRIIPVCDRRLYYFTYCNRQKKEITIVIAPTITTCFLPKRTVPSHHLLSFSRA